MPGIGENSTDATVSREEMAAVPAGFVGACERERDIFITVASTPAATNHRSA